MHARALALACAVLAPWGASAQPADPVETAARFFEAAQSRPCAEVWAFYSAGTQQAIRAQVHRRERERAGAPQKEVPEELHCRRSGQLKKGTARLVRSHGNEAVVAAGFGGRQVSSNRLLPGRIEWNEELRLVREGGSWKVALALGKVEPAYPQLTEVGPVDVFIEPVVRGLHQRLEATSVSRAPRAGLEAVVRDPEGWASVLPSFKAIEPLERAGELDRVRLSFADPSTPVPMRVRLSAKAADPMKDATTIAWDVEGDTRAPAYMRGRWDLTPNTDGTTRVKLTLVIDPRHWPEGLFSAERMANAVRDLEKAALKAP